MTANTPEAEPIAWEAPHGYGIKRFVSDRIYRLYSPKVQRFYKPFKCASCANLPPPQGDADHATMLRLLDTAITHGHLPTWQAERRELVKRLKATPQSLEGYEFGLPGQPMLKDLPPRNT